MKFLKQTLMCWLVIFIISGITASNSTGFFERLLYSLIMGVIASVMLAFTHLGSKTNYKASSKGSQSSVSRVVQKKNGLPVIYVYENFKPQFKYRIEDNRIYEGFSPSFSYTIKDNKIYKGMGNGQFLYRIEPHHSGNGQRVYKEFCNTPAFKVVDNKVYEGEFGTQVLYRLSDSNKGVKNYSA
ncbi:MAG: hypothetical protein IJC12_03265 [Peptococcaceae bacterium]|nr:hypothetical protein [Peptococcaceae bacterium]